MPALAEGSHIGVVGCGTAGPAAALGFAQAGYRVSLFEKVARPTPVGAGIMLQPTGQLALARLGLHQEVERASSAIDTLRCVTSEGKTLLNLAYPAPFRGWGVHRGVLFYSLYQAGVEHPQIQIRTGCEATAFENNAEGVSLSFTSDGLPQSVQVDLLVIADGARSSLRRRYSRGFRPYPYGALWFVAKDHDSIFSRELFQVVQEAKTMCGFLPSGYGPDGERCTSLFWSVAKRDVDQTRSQLSNLKRRIETLSPSAAVLTAQVNEPEQLIFAEYFDGHIPLWPESRVMFLGDAGHSMSPQLGQGANLALLDAIALVDSVQHSATLEAARTEFLRSRNAHLRYYQWATRFLTPFFQSDSWLLGQLRDFGMPLANRLPFFRNMMISTMMGIRRGWFRASMALPSAESRGGRFSAG